jgi:hypothetical protein
VPTYEVERVAAPAGRRHRTAAPSPASAFAGRDAERFGASVTPAPAPGLALPMGPVAVAGLVAAAWIGPEGPRTELLTAAALLGATFAALRSAPPAAGAPNRALALPRRLTDDELRDALAAW